MLPKGYQVRITILILALIALIMTSACAMIDTRDKQLLISGTTLQAGSEQFVQVGNMANSMLNSKQITPEQYRPWAAFAKHFKEAYPLAVDSWVAVNKSGDVATQTKLEVVIRDMLAGLSKFSQFFVSYLAPPPNAVPPVAAAK